MPNPIAQLAAELGTVRTEQIDEIETAANVLNWLASDADPADMTATQLMLDQAATICYRLAERLYDEEAV